MCFLCCSPRQARNHPLNTHAEPDEVAAVVAFLASADAGFVTGVCMPLDGGVSTTFWANDNFQAAAKEDAVSSAH